MIPQSYLQGVFIFYIYIFTFAKIMLPCNILSLHYLPLEAHQQVYQTVRTFLPLFKFRLFFLTIKTHLQCSLACGEDAKGNKEKFMPNKGNKEEDAKSNVCYFKNIKPRNDIINILKHDMNC